MVITNTIMQKMNRFVSLFHSMFMLMLLLRRASTNESAKGIIGAIIDDSSRIGKEQTVAMNLALKDFFSYSNQSFDLQIRKSTQGDPLQAAFAAIDLVSKQKVQAIVGPQKWEEISLVAEVCSQNSTPLLPLADATPNWATKKWPFLLQTSPTQFLQMKAIAAIVQSYEWPQVSIIYEDTDSSFTEILSHFSTALREAGAEISNLVSISPFVSSLSLELEKLKEGQCRVFVVHLSFPLALQFFKLAKKMEMIEKDYVWITTDPFTSLVHSLNSSTLSSMKGIIGVRSYFPESGQKYEEFYRKFRREFSLVNLEEYNYEPGIFAAQAYDAMWAVALATTETNNSGGQVLLNKILLNNFTSLSGKFEFTDNNLSATRAFQIINVNGRGYREVGLWSDGPNFSKSIGPNATYNSSMESLGPLFWPGGAFHTPRGWIIPAGSKPLRIGVPSKSIFKQYVNINIDPSDNTTSFEGFAIAVFKAIVELLPYHLEYEFFDFGGTYDSLVEQISLKNYDAVVGDVSIVSDRYKHVDFTQPYTDLGMVMVVPVQSKAGNKEWLFLKPFTKVMWILILAIIVYNGFVVWIIERNHRPELKGPLLHQTGTMLCLAFTTLFSLHGDKLHSKLSRMAIVVWLFVALIISQIYTASLASMLTVEQFEPSVDNIEMLRSSNAMVGYDRGSYLKKYLHQVLQFRPENLKQIESPELYAQALRRKEIAAAFLDVAESKIFLAQYCKEFVKAGPMYKTGGFGFAFPKGSLLVHSVNKALLKLSEDGKLRDLQDATPVLEKCKDTELDGKSTSLSAGSFWVLFILTAGTSTIALLACIVPMINSWFGQKIITWGLLKAVSKYWVSQKRRFSRSVSNVAESPLNSPNTPNLLIHV